MNDSVINAKVDIEVKEGKKTGTSGNNSEKQKKMLGALKRGLSDVNKLGKETGNTLKNMFNVANTASWISILKSAIGKQSEYVENLNMMKVAFGDTADSAESFINTISSDIGFDASQLTRQLGIFRQISDSLGIAGEKADLLSTNLSKLSLDISSLYNVDVERAGKALESAITGQVRSIRSLTGADITQATLQQDALAMGISKQVSEMSRAEKTILIYLSLEKQLGNANGDLSRTINTKVAKTRNCFWKKLVNVFQNGVRLMLNAVKQEMAYL